MVGPGIETGAGLRWCTVIMQANVAQGIGAAALLGALVVSVATILVLWARPGTNERREDSCVFCQSKLDLGQEGEVRTTVCQVCGETQPSRKGLRLRSDR
jgi:hypothetical protein